MIGRLKGTIETIGDDYLILDVHGVGYVVQCSARTLSAVPAVGEALILSIETQVREDAIRLFGFRSDIERDWFRLLQNVQGVGAKVALAILSILTPHELAQAIGLQDKAMIGRASGVGPKLAARIVSELRDKTPVMAVVESGAARLAGDEAYHAPKPVQDAISALINLGYGRPQAASAIAASLASLGEGAETSALIRQGLKELAQ